MKDGREPAKRVEIGEPELEVSKRQEALPFRCQRCKQGVYVPERDLHVCPECARAVCAKCRIRYPEIEADICLDCARAKLARGRAGRQALMYWLKLLASAAAVGIGVLLALKGLWAIGAVFAVFGVVGGAWYLVVFHRCPLCYGNAVARRTKAGLIYRCTLCRHEWHE